MKSCNNLTLDQRRILDGVAFWHFCLWRTVYKELSVITPIRVMVDPYTTRLNLILVRT